MILETDYDCTVLLLLCFEIAKLLFVSSQKNTACYRSCKHARSFLSGVRDRVKCFHCNGGLQNWSQGDDPWYEHAKWYPTCEFLLQQKCPEFIQNVVARFPNIERPRLAAPGRDVPPPVPR